MSFLCVFIYTLSLYLSLFIWLFIYLSMYLSLYRSMYISISLCIYLPLSAFTYLSVYLSICLSIYQGIYVSIYLSTSLYIYQSVVLNLSLHPFFSLSTLPLSSSSWREYLLYISKADPSVHSLSKSSPLILFSQHPSSESCIFLSLCWKGKATCCWSIWMPKRKQKNWFPLTRLSTVFFCFFFNCCGTFYKIQTLTY